MTYKIRPLEELSAEARGFIAASVDGALTPVWPNTFGVIAKVLAMIGQENELRRAWLYDQLFLTTCSEASLERYAYEEGMVRDPGAPATGAAVFAADIGTSVPDDLRFVRGDGRSYRSVGVANSVGLSVTVQLEAEEIGLAGNAPAGVSIRLAADSAGPAGLNPVGAVTSAGLIGGADEEDAKDLRRRAVIRRREPPACGNAADWERWTREAIPNVTRVFVDNFTDEPAPVWLQFTVTDQPSGIPSPAQVAAVQAYVQDPVRRPMGARVFVSAPTVSPVNVVITGLFQDTPAIRAAIASEITAAFAEQVGTGAPSAPFLLRRNLIGAAIARILGEVGYTLVEPVGNLSFPVGVLPTLGSIAYV